MPGLGLGLFTLGVMGGGGSNAYTGLVATAHYVPDGLSAPNKQMMSRTPHFARDDITSVQLVYSNFRVVSGAEVGLGSAATIEASVEYPSGTYTRVLFSGVNQGSITSGGILVSDPVSVSIPDGAQFWCRQWSDNPDGMIYVNAATASAASGIGFSFGVTTTNLVVTDGAFAANTISYGPLAIIGTTTKASVALLGDSRVFGVGDTPDATCFMGSVARSIAPTKACTNLGCSADTAVGFAASSTNRRAIAAYCSHIVCEYGANDMAAPVNNTAEQALASLQTIYGLDSIAGKPIYQTTAEPYSVSSTDGYITEANQTVNPVVNPKLQTFNTAIRAGTANVVGIFDIDSLALGSTVTPGKWLAPGGVALTADGVHANAAGYARVVSQAVIDPGLFTR